MVVYYCVNLAKLELCFPEFLSLYIPRLKLSKKQISIIFRKQKWNRSHYSVNVSTGFQVLLQLDHTVIICWFTLSLSGISQILNPFSSNQISSSTSVSPQLSMCATLWQRAPVSSIDHLHCWGYRWWEIDMRPRLSLWGSTFSSFSLASCIVFLLIYSSFRPNTGIRRMASNRYFQQLSQLCKI